MSAPAVQCPLCKRVVKIVPSTTNFSGLAVEEHTYQGGIGDFIDRLLQVQWSVRCPMSGAAADTKAAKR